MTGVSRPEAEWMSRVQGVSALLWEFKGHDANGHLHAVAIVPCGRRTLPVAQGKRTVQVPAERVCTATMTAEGLVYSTTVRPCAQP
jgi:hypothetical protein